MELSAGVFGRAGVREGQYAELRAERTVTLELVWRGRDMTAASVTTEEGGCARVITARGSSFASFTGHDHAGALRAARLQAPLLGSAGPTGLAPAEPVRGQFGPAVPAPAGLPGKIEMLAAYAEQIMGAHPSITGSLVHFRQVARDVELVTTEGTQVAYGHVDLTLQMTVYASGPGTAVGSVSAGSAGDFAAVTGLESRIDEACRSAVESLTAPASEPGCYDVVCDGSLAGIWAHETIGHLAEADHQEPGTVPAMAGPPWLSVIDTGGPPSARGHVVIDDEGVRCRDVDLIRDGVIGGRLHSRETAHAFGEKPTGNARSVGFGHPPIPRLRTTCVLPGPHRLADMIGTTGRGLLASGFYGGQTDRMSFTFTPAECRLIEDGEVRGRVRAPVLSGRISDALGRIDMVGDDLWDRDTSASCGKLGQWPLPVSSFAPSIRIRGIDVG